MPFDRSQVRRTLGRVRRKLKRLRPGSANARIEKAISEVRDGVSKQVDRMQTDVARMGTNLAAVDTRLAGLEKSLAELARRPVPPPPPRSPPKSLGTQALEENVVLTGLTFEGQRPRVVILLQNYGTQMLFAGIRTALITAVELSRRLDRPLALVVLEPLLADVDTVRAELAEWLTDELDAGDRAASLTVSAPENIRRRDGHADDIWLATFWTTAFQLGRLCAAGTIDPKHVVYLVQDWEPSFYSWGTEHALAVSTYGLGFHLLVNSSSLADYVSERTGSAIDADQVIAPQVDETRLQQAAAAWEAGSTDEPRVLFYARPTKPRNLYTLGLAALRDWAATVPPSVHPIVTFAGEDLAAPPDLGPGVTVRAAGKVDMDEYYDLLSHTDVGIALMQSPHPSHLALEMPMAGIPTLTNAVEDHRKAWVDGLQVVDATPQAISNALYALVDSAKALREHTFVPLGDSLGKPLGTCIDALVSRLPEPSTTTAD